MTARPALAAVPSGDDRDKAASRIHVVSNPDAIRTLRAALNDQVLPETYVRDGRPTVIERISGTPILDPADDAPLPVTATTLTSDTLARMLAEHTTVMRATTNGDVEWTPSASVLGPVLSGAEWPGLPPLTGIVGIPTVRTDGTLAQARGYDPMTGVYLAPIVHVAQIPEAPTAAEVAASRRWLLAQLLADFPWRSPADLANYIGLLVSPYLRRYLRSLVPLGIVTASMPASGKTLLTALLGLLAGQKQMPWVEDDTELRKQITSVLCTTAGVILIDNVPEGTELGSATLAGLLTAETWSDRGLGGNRIISVPNDRVWLVTGNNLRTAGDISSRSVVVRLAPDAPHPEERTDFRIPGLIERILTREFQAEVLRHLLVLVVDWTRAGGPRDGTQAMRQFTGWAQGIGGFLAHHGIGGFLDNTAETRQEDAEDQRWASFLTRWLDVLGREPQRVSDIFDSGQTYRDELGRKHDQWDGDFIKHPEGHKSRDAQALGILLSGHVDRFHGSDPSMRLRRVWDKHNKGWRYHVEECPDRSMR